MINGTRTTTITNAEGYVIGETETDIATGLEIASALATQIDSFGRPEVITYNDGSTVTTLHGCCGVESRTDRNGITTTFARTDTETSSTVLGITTSTRTEGNQSIVKRIGTGRLGNRT